MPKFRREVKIIFGVIIIFLLVVFVQTQLRNRICKKIIITFSHPDIPFVIKEDILQLLSKKQKDVVIGKKHKDLDFQELENRVKASPYISNCQISRDLSGDLYVNVIQKKPIARFMLTGKKDFYLDSLGAKMPITQRFTARVPIVTADTTMRKFNFKKNKLDKKFLKLLQYIDNDKFFKAQIAHLNLDKKKNIKMYLQIGNQVVDFGKSMNFEDKLKRLLIFYRKIIPIKGWKAYKTISLKFNNQIVCQ